MWVAYGFNSGLVQVFSLIHINHLLPCLIYYIINLLGSDGFGQAPCTYWLGPLCTPSSAKLVKLIIIQGHHLRSLSLYLKLQEKSVKAAKLFSLKNFPIRSRCGQ